MSNQLFAQSKDRLSFNDARLWRSKSVSLSDNGKWYTTSYRLFDQPDFKKDALLKKAFRVDLVRVLSRKEPD